MVCTRFMWLTMSGSYVHSNELQGFINAWHFLTSCRNTSSSRRTLLRGIIQSAD